MAMNIESQGGTGVARLRVKSCPKRRLIAQDILAEIKTSDLGPGDRLPSMETLARRYSVSIRTVHQALEELEGLGYLRKFHGAGTFVLGRHQPMTPAETVVVCMESQAHTFSELFGEIMRHLHERQMTAVAVEPSHSDVSTTLLRIRHSGALCYLLHASVSFPFSVFTEPAMGCPRVIAFVSWHSDVEWPGLFRVLSDFPTGGRMVADMLWERGHRNVLVLGTGTDEVLIGQPSARGFFAGVSFAEHWTEVGGKWQFMRSREDASCNSGVTLDAERLLKILSAEDAPTAIVGTRDVEVWQAQQILSACRPSLLSRIERIGYYDTPWSRSADPPFSTVSLSLPAMADAAMTILDALRVGRDPPRKTILIEPTLVIRDQNISPRRGDIAQ